MADSAPGDARTEGSDDHLAWKRTTVDGRDALYGVAGTGVPVLFLHGWGLGQHSYKRALKRLVVMGCRVYAPALPGFGGTADLPGDRMDFAGYADWVAAFAERVGIDEPVFLVGHSFGGGVAIKLAHEHPERVRFVVLVNSVGGSAWKGEGTSLRTLAERPLWDWGLHFPGDIFPLRQLRKVLPVLLEDLLPNAVRNPMAFWRVGNIARRADLRPELEALRERGTPVVVLWGERDGVMPRASFDAMCEAIGAEGELVTGAHSWLLADPDAFGEVMTNVLRVAEVAREQERAEAAAAGKEPPPEREVASLSVGGRAAKA